MMPKKKEVVELLEGLVGKRVTATPNTQAKKRCSVLAEYNDADSKLQFVLAADPEFACRAGAALAMMPVSVADGAIRTGITDELIENYYEVANVLTAMFRNQQRIVLGRVFRPSAADAPKELAKSARTGKQRLDLSLDIEGYGPGTLSLVRVA